MKESQKYYVSFPWLSSTWNDMTLHDKKWCDMTLCDMTWCFVTLPADILRWLEFCNVWASVNQQTIPDQTIVSTTSQVNKDSSPVHYQTMVWWDFFFSLRLKTLTCIISTLFLSFIRPWLPHQTINTFKNKSTCLFSSIRPWQPHQTINTFYQESTHFFSSIRPWSDGLFL